MFTEFDQGILALLNGFSQQSLAFDRAVVEMSRNDLLKGGVLIGLLWWCWTRREGGLLGQDLHAPRTVIGALLGILVGRAMQNYLPMRLRPGHEPSLEFTLPHMMNMDALDGWSSFPSDHALLFFGLAAAVWAVSRPLGWVAFLWTALVICLPRMYLGLHYPTDVIVGGLVGIAVMALALKVPLPGILYRGLGTLQCRHPGVVYALAFLGTFQMATLFNSSRRLAQVAAMTLNGS